jgi:hypothetical protein
MIDYSILNKILIKPLHSLGKEEFYYECFYYWKNEKIFKRAFVILDKFNLDEKFFITKYLSWKNNSDIIFYNNDYTKDFTYNINSMILNSNFEITRSMHPYIHYVKLDKKLIAFSEKDIEKILKIKLIESIID